MIEIQVSKESLEALEETGEAVLKDAEGNEIIIVIKSKP